MKKYRRDLKFCHSVCMFTQTNKYINGFGVNLGSFGNENQTVRSIFSPIGMLLSVPFIIATFFVYLCIPELCNLHRKCLLCYLIVLAVGYVTMAFVQLNGNNYMEPIPCKSIGYVMYFSFLSAFLWLSVISFNLWFDFR